MFSPSFDDLVEVFLIEAEEVHLVGTLTHLTDNKGKVDGRVKFHDGQKLHFSSQIEDRDVLSERLMIMCRSIADFYGSDMIHQKFRRDLAFAESIGHLNTAAQVMH